MDIVEVGPRDGLQSEAAVLDPAIRIELVRRLVDAGMRRIEVASFVHPRRVPQMAGAEEVVAGLPELPGVSYIGLVLNRRGLERALATAVHEINFVVAAAEGYNRHNQSATVAETMAEIEMMIPAARAAGRNVSVTISVAFGDPYDGEVPVTAVTDLARRAAAAGADEIALGDTIGVGVPAMVTERLAAVREAAPRTAVRCHFHNTRNTGYANAVAAVAAGVDALDSAVGGYGGSPFAPAAGGNIATEDLLFLLQRSGIDTGLSLPSLVAITAWLAPVLGSPAPAMQGVAGSFPFSEEL
jgi:hydroxymethylglutaryl-CoA lyase